MKLWRYITGSRKGKEAHRIEKDAMSDPFLADALEGYDKVKGDHQSNVELLQKRIQSKTRKKPQTLRAWSIAASILIVIGLGTYFLVNEKAVSPETDLYTLSPVTHSIDSTNPDPVPVPVIAEATPKAKKALKPAVKATVTESNDMAIKAESQALTRSKTSFTRSSKTSPLIKGRIVSPSGDPLIGVNVFLKDKPSLGTISDANGDFVLKANHGSTLQVNYIGFEPITLKADTGKPLLIAMKQDSKTLSEVVVSAGIVNRAKSGFTGSYINESREELKAVGNTNIDSSLLNISSIEMVKPVPVDGWKKYRKYLKKNLIRPTGECKKIKGEVTLSFFVDTLGSPQFILVIKSLCPSADQEAIRLVKEGPKWTVEKGKAEVNVKF